MYKSDHALEQGWVRTPRTHPLDTRLVTVIKLCGPVFKGVYNALWPTYSNFGVNVRRTGGTIWIDSIRHIYIYTYICVYCTAPLSHGWGAP